MTDTTPCRTCDGTGNIPHPNWGAWNCPEPWIICPQCNGED